MEVGDHIFVLQQVRELDGDCWRVTKRRVISHGPRMCCVSGSAVGLDFVPTSQCFAKEGDAVAALGSRLRRVTDPEVLGSLATTQPAESP